MRHQNAQHLSLIPILLLALIAGSTHAYPQLAPPIGAPSIESDVTMSYWIHSDEGRLLMLGTPHTLVTTQNGPAQIVSGDLGFSAVVHYQEQTAGALLTITGTVPSLGFTSGSLLSGDLIGTTGAPGLGVTSLGQWVFLLNIVGGDAAGLYGGVGSQAAVLIDVSFGDRFDYPYGHDSYSASILAYRVGSPPVILLLAIGLAGITARGNRQ